MVGFLDCADSIEKGVGLVLTLHPVQRDSLMLQSHIQSYANDSPPRPVAAFLMDANTGS